MVLVKPLLGGVFKMPKPSKPKDRQIPLLIEEKKEMRK
jgi:hypothetical protein